MDEGQLEPRVTYEDDVEIYCLSCSWKQTLGLDAVHNLVNLADVTSVTPLTSD
jgi:hypothetical protein